jgi:hypothetical protein
VTSDGRLDDRAPELYALALRAVDDGCIEQIAHLVEGELAAVGRWRWFYRLRLRRQLHVVQLARACYRAGRARRR